MKKYPHGLTLNAVCAAIDDYQHHEDSVPEEGILAAFNTLLGHSDIAEALRSMERTADANTAAAQAMRDDMYHWKQRAEAAEAKLAEMEKQANEPAGYAPKGHVERYLSGKNSGCWVYGEPTADDNEPLFTRPAPAINLTEMVPGGWKLVPVEPDWEMLSADGCKEHHNGQPCLHHDNRKRIWSAMLAAAPNQPQ